MDHAALDEYMGIWFRGEVPDAVELCSTAVIFHKNQEERIENRCLVIDHLEKVRGCPTYGWLKRLKENNVEDLEQLGILNVFAARMYVTVLYGRSRINAAPHCTGDLICLAFLLRISELLQETVVAYDDKVNFIQELEAVPGIDVTVKTAEFLNENL
ncbi:hypothetical protein Tco_1427432 [Tanacetum coccineum]